MNTFVLTYSFVPNMLERRAPHRDAHFAHLEKAVAEDHLILAGPFDDPYDGGMLLVRFNSRGEVMDWAAQDPYIKAGLAVEVSVRPFTIVMAEPALAALVSPR